MEKFLTKFLQLSLSIFFCLVLYVLIFRPSLATSSARLALKDSLHPIHLWALVFLPLAFIAGKLRFQVSRQMGRLLIMTSGGVILACLFYLPMTRSVKLVDDSRIVLENALVLLQGHQIEDSYMAFTSNNFPLILLYKGILWFFPRAWNPHKVIILFFTSLYCLFFTLKTIGWLRKPHFSRHDLASYLLFWGLSTALLPHIYNAYTDILTWMGLLVILPWIKKGLEQESLTYLIGATFFLAILTTFKILNAIVFIALMLVLIMKYLSSKWSCPLAVLLSFVIVFVPLQMGIGHLQDQSFAIPVKTAPPAHYLAMGIENAYLRYDMEKEELIAPGAWNKNDVAFSMNFLYGDNGSLQELSRIKIDLWKERWRQLRSHGIVKEFFRDKFAYQWGTGDWKSSFLLKLSLNLQDFHYWLPYYVIAHLSYLGLVGASLAKVLSSFKKTGNWPYMELAALATGGYFLFLTFWESSPRYLTGIAPLWLMLLEPAREPKPST